MTLRLSSGPTPAATSSRCRLPPARFRGQPDAEPRPDAAAQSDAKGESAGHGAGRWREPVAVPIPASSHPDAPIDVFIDSGAQWRGITNSVNALRIGDGTWTVTGSSAVNSLHLQAGRMAYATPAESDGKFQHLRVKTLSGKRPVRNERQRRPERWRFAGRVRRGRGQHKVLVREPARNPPV